MSHYKFQRLVLLAKIEPTKFGDRNHLVSEVKRQGIRKRIVLHLLLLFQNGGE